MGNVVFVYDRAGATDAVADVLSQLCNIDTIAGGTGGEALRGEAIDIGVFVKAEAENGISSGGGDASC